MPISLQKNSQMRGSIHFIFFQLDSIGLPVGLVSVFVGRNFIIRQVALMEPDADHPWPPFHGPRISTELCLMSEYFRTKLREKDFNDETIY